MFIPSIHDVIPLPSAVTPSTGAGFTITADTVVVVSAGDDRALWTAKYLADVIGLAAAPQPPRVEVAGASVPRGAISLEIGDTSIAGAEAYELDGDRRPRDDSREQPAGLFYGVQTFRQLLPAFVEYQAACGQTRGVPWSPPPAASRIGRGSGGAARCSTSRGISSPSTTSSATST